MAFSYFYLNLQHLYTRIRAHAHFSMPSHSVVATLDAFVLAKNVSAGQCTLKYHGWQRLRDTYSHVHRSLSVVRTARVRLLYIVRIAAVWSAWMPRAI